MSKIDTIGVYLGEIIESAVNLTQKNSYPQWVCRVKATKKWVDDAEGMAHFQITEPGYVDWSSFNEETVGYLVLFKDSQAFNEDTKLLNYEQVQLATGWDGQAFDTLAGEAVIGRTIQFRMDEDTYEGKTSLKLNWVDSPDAPAQRSLKTLDAADLKSLSARLSIKRSPKAAASVAKPANPTKPAAKSVAAGAAKAPATAAPAAAVTSPSATPAPAAPAPSPASPSPASKPASAKPAPVTSKPSPASTPPPPSAPQEEGTGLPPECDKLAAWAYVTEHKGNNGDDTVTDAWLSACQEVGGDRDEEAFTPADWAKTRDLIIKDLDLK